MLDKEAIARIVAEVLAAQDNGSSATNTVAAPTGKVGVSDYPLAEKRKDLLRTPTGKTLDDITLDNVMNGNIKPEDVRIAPETLELQAQVAEAAGRAPFARNLRRAAEMIKIPDARLLQMYDALRPYRSSKQELLDIANELENQYGAKVCANLVRETAEVYEARDRLK